MNIVLTGASKGIGYGTALAFCKYPVHNMILIARDLKALNKLKSECLKINNSINITVISGDLAEITRDSDRFLSKIPFKELDVLINNAGFLVRKPFLEIQEAEITRMLNMNTVIPALLVRTLFDLLKISSSSHVVNIGSMAGFQGSSKYPGLSFYGASKAAMASLTESLAKEFSQTSIRFNCLAIGAVQTEMLNEAFPGYHAPLIPSEMGEFIADFALHGHKYFNGQVIPVALSNP